MQTQKNTEMNELKIPANKNIHDFLMEEFGIDFPISTGNGLTIENAIVMHLHEDYVHSEYEIIEFLGYSRSIQWERVNQELITYDNKYIDRITIMVSELEDGTDTWTEIYYFDVTANLINNEHVVAQKPVNE